MAAPQFVQASAGVTMTGATASLSLTGVTVGSLIIAQVIEDGYDGNGADFSWGTLTGGEALDGTDGVLDQLAGDVYTNGWVVGPAGTPTAVQWIALFRATATSVSLGLASSGNDCYARMYEFSGVNPGTTLAAVLENVSAGVALNGSATSASVADTGVTTLGADRLALNFIAVNDDNQAELTAMTGESGGDWTYPVAAYGNATGTDGAVALVTATIASQGTINGGSDAMTSDSWGNVGFALIPAGATGAVVFPITADRVVQGKVGYKGAVAFPITANRIVAGRLTAKAAAVASFALNRVVDGKRTRFGAVVAPFALNRVTAGSATRTGTVVFPIAAGVQVSGRIVAKGAVAMPLTLNRVVLGRATAKGAVVFPLSFTIFAQAATTTRYGAVVMPLTLDRVVAARLTARSAVVLPLTVGIFVDGAVEGGAADWFGSVVMPTTWSAVTSGHIFIYVRPAIDSVDGTWTDQGGGSNLSAAVDEEVFSDADYIISELDPSASACRLKLQAISDPAASYGHSITWRVGKNDAGGDQMDVEISLYQGGGDVLGAGTLIASFSRLNVGDTFATFEEQLSGGQADAITDYADLYLEFEATAA